MIGPSATDIIAMRWRVRILLRLATLTLTIIALAWIALRLREFFEVRQMAGSGFARSPNPLDFDWFAVPVAILAVAFVLALVAQFGLAMIVAAPEYYLSLGWLHAKLALVALLIGYHVWCWRIVLTFRAGRNRRNHVWYRWFNEAPALLLVAIVLLAVLKPF